MANKTNIEGMIDSTPIMGEFADVTTGAMPEYTIDSKIPEGPIAEKWTNYKAHQHLVNPANKRNLDIIVVGTGLAGASAASTLGEMGFNVYNFCIQDSPRRAHSIAAQGGINAAKNYRNDGDSVYRLFYDTVKGGDFRSREANVYRLAEVSEQHHRPVRSAGRAFRPRVRRPSGQPLVRRRTGKPYVLRQGPTGQQLLLGAYSSLNRRYREGTVRSFTRREMLDIVIIDGRARGIIVRNLITGAIERYAAHAVVLATGGYGRAFFLSTNAMGCNGSAAVQAFKKGAYLANLAFTDSPLHVSPVHGEDQSKLTLMPSESLRNDGRIRYPPRRKTPRQSAPARNAPPTSPTKTATSISNAATPHSATSAPATSPRVPPKSAATPATAWVRATPYTSTSSTPSSAWARTWCATATATCSTCTG